MNAELVSVIIPTHGRPKFLKRSIQSVLDQTYPNIELIVVDDNGEGNLVQLETANAISSFGDSVSIKYIIHKTNCGGSVARNTGAGEARGIFLAFLDDDDEYDPEHIQKQLDFLILKSKNDSRLKACSSLVIRRKFGKDIDHQIPKFQTNYMVDLLAMQSSLYTGSSLLIDKTAFDTLGGYDPQFVRNQDIEFMIRFFERFDLVVLNEHLTVLNVEDRSHIPSYQKILATKKLFLSKFQPIISTLDPDQQRMIYRNNSLEIAKVALWNRNLSGFINAAINAKLSVREWVGFLADIGKKAIMHLK